MTAVIKINERLAEKTAAELGLLCIDIIRLKDRCAEKGLNDVVYFLELALTQAIDDIMQEDN